MCAGVRLTSQDIVCWHSRQQNVLVIGSLKVIVLAAVDTWRRFIVGTGELELSRRLAVPALPSYIQWKMEDDHTYHNM